MDGENMTSYILDINLGEENQYSNRGLQVSAKELIIFLSVMGLWTWACSLCYFRWRKISRLETCQAFRPEEAGTPGTAGTGTGTAPQSPPEIILSEQGDYVERRRPSHKASVSSTLTLPNPAIPGRRPSMVLITDHLLMMRQLSRDNTTGEPSV